MKKLLFLLVFLPTIVKAQKLDQGTATRTYNYIGGLSSDVYWRVPLRIPHDWQYNHDTTGMIGMDPSSKRLMYNDGTTVRVILGGQDTASFIVSWYKLATDLALKFNITDTSGHWVGVGWLASLMKYSDSSQPWFFTTYDFNSAIASYSTTSQMNAALALKEDVANKTGDSSLSTASTTKYTSEYAARWFVMNRFATLMIQSNTWTGTNQFSQPTVFAKGFLVNSSVSSTTPGSGFVLYSDASNNINFNFVNSSSLKLDVSAISRARSQLIRDEDGAYLMAVDTVLRTIVTKKYADSLSALHELLTNKSNDSALASNSSTKYTTEYSVRQHVANRFATFAAQFSSVADIAYKGQRDTFQRPCKFDSTVYLVRGVLLEGVPNHHTNIGIPGSLQARIFADSIGRLCWRRNDGFFRTFDATNMTADRSWRLPNQSGQLIVDTALTVDATLLKTYAANGVQITTNHAVDIASSGVASWDVAAAPSRYITITSLTGLSITNALTGVWYYLEVTQGGSGSSDIAFSTWNGASITAGSIKFGGENTGNGGSSTVDCSNPVGYTDGFLISYNGSTWTVFVDYDLNNR